MGKLSAHSDCNTYISNIFQTADQKSKGKKRGAESYRQYITTLERLKEEYCLEALNHDMRQLFRNALRPSLTETAN